MEEFNQTTVWELLKIMQQKVRDNSVIIQKNVKSAELVKEKYDKSLKRDKIIERLYKKNYELTKENTQMLELHNYLFKFHKDFKHLLTKTPTTVDSDTLENYREDCMTRTIQGNLKIDQQHPYWNDADFMDELLVKCSEMELYELCSEITQIKNLHDIGN